MTGPAPGPGSIALRAGHVPVQNPSWADVRAQAIHSSAWSSHAEARLTRPPYSLADHRDRLDRAEDLTDLAAGRVVGVDVDPADDARGVEHDGGGHRQRPGAVRVHLGHVET